MVHSASMVPFDSLGGAPGAIHILVVVFQCPTKLPSRLWCSPGEAAAIMACMSAADGWLGAAAGWADFMGSAAASAADGMAATSSSRPVEAARTRTHLEHRFTSIITLLGLREAAPAGCLRLIYGVLYQAGPEGVNGWQRVAVRYHPPGLRRRRA